MNPEFVWRYAALSLWIAVVVRWVDTKIVRCLNWHIYSSPTKLENAGLAAEKHPRQMYIMKSCMDRIELRNEGLRDFDGILGRQFHVLDDDKEAPNKLFFCEYKSSYRNKIINLITFNHVQNCITDSFQCNLQSTHITNPVLVGLLPTECLKYPRSDEQQSWKKVFKVLPSFPLTLLAVYINISLIDILLIFSYSIASASSACSSIHLDSHPLSYHIPSPTPPALHFHHYQTCPNPMPLGPPHTPTIQTLPHYTHSSLPAPSWR